MDMHLLRIAICVGFFTIGSLCAAEAGSGKIPEAGERPRNQPITVKATEAGEERVWAMGSSRRSRHLYPSNYGQAGIFRVRSAESLPPYSVTFGIGGEFYAISNAPMFAGSTRARTIAENLFVGFSPVEHLTLGITRRSSSTTFGQPQTLISSLGDFNFAAAYAFPLGEAMVLSPMVNLQVASNFNSLAPAGSTVSAGLGAAFTYSLYPTVGLPIFLHANLLYHGPQIRTNKGPTLEEETFFNFSRFHTVTFAFGAEYILGDFIPFLEFHQSTQAGSGLGWADSPSRFTVGTRITPLSNKSLALLVGTDIGLGQGLVAGVPFNPDYQIVAQASYTVALTQTERKHYFTSQDVNVVDRKFVIRKKIRFKVNSAELEPSSAGLLDQIAEVIRRNNVEKLLIVGHTDSTASEDYNLKLSLARAGSVKSYLVSQGIEADKLLTQGYGKRQPVASNLTEEGRARNRRVEFFILEQSS